ncbi:MAG: PKD domain-containing protein [Thalassobius sp.]|nr:PKD domain-containing protein [Thalassovita sp.]
MSLNISLQPEDFQIRPTIFYLFLMLTGFSLQADPFLFKENKNQWDSDILYRADLPGGYLFLQNGAFTYVFYDESAVQAKHQHANSSASNRVSVADLPDNSGTIGAHGFQVNFYKSSSDVNVVPLNPFSNSYNYFLGNNPEKWASNVKAYSQIIYQGLYDGIDLKYYHNGEDFKYEFIVAPGSNTKKIKMDYEGQSEIELINGNLYIRTTVNELIEQKPYSYQIINGVKKEVVTEFSLKNKRLTFEFPEGYDENYELVIDPVLVFSTFSGSVSDNWGNTATYDDAGSLYAGGIVFGNDFPSTTGAFQVNFAEEIDIAITKYDSTGSYQIYATYLGGEDTEVPQSLVVNSNNELVIFGTTSSPDFPVTNTAYDTTFDGGVAGTVIGGVDFNNGSDIFTAKLNPDGSELLGSTFFGGYNTDGINELTRLDLSRNYGDELRGDVITDDDGNIYIATSTHSSNIVITTGEALQGQQDGLIAKFNSDLSALIWSRLLGGGGRDAVYNIKLNNADEIIVVGGTTSQDFPTTDNVLYEEFQGGRTDGFLTIISNDGTQIIESTYLGTDAYDQAYLLDLDVSGNITVFGQTSGDYPVSVNTYSNEGSGQFVHKIGSGLKTTIFSTVIGSGSGSPDICPTALLVNECSNIYLAGWGGNVNAVNGNYVGGYTYGLPITEDAYQSTTDGSDFYLMVLSADADELLYATYFGGNAGTGEHVDGGTSRFDKKGVVYHSVCSCGQSNYPTTVGAFDRINNSTSETSTATRCNNAAFKFDMAILEASFEYGPEIPCLPSPVTFSNTSLGGTNFIWEINGVVIDVATDTGFVYMFEEPGDYTVKLTAFDAATCTAQDVYTETISVGEQEFAVADGGFICGGEEFQLEASGATIYRWSPQTYLSNPNIANPVATSPETIEYTVTMINDFGCRADSMVTITVQPEVIADFQVNVIETCDTLNQVEIINNSQNVAEYAWVISDDRIINTEDPGTLTFEEPGTYQIVLVGINETCSDTDTIEVDVNVVESSLFYRDVTISPTQEICYGESVQLEVTGGVAYTWSPLGSIDNPSSSTPIVSPTENTTYSVRIYNKNSCFIDTTVQVNVFPEIVSEFNVSVNDECGEKPILTFENLSEGAATYVWDFGNNESYSDIIPDAYVYPDTGTYTITLHATQGECTESFSREVIIEQVVPPNAISPNDDAVNEKFIIPSKLSGWQIEIYNRWGDLVYENDNYNGEWGGEDLPESVYHYLLISPYGAECRGWVKVMK